MKKYVNIKQRILVIALLICFFAKDEFMHKSAVEKSKTFHFFMPKQELVQKNIER